MRSICLTLVALLMNIPNCPLASAESPEPRWWKGNMHTHSLWSDGDDFPEMIGDWYRQQGYNFLGLSDHNTLSEGMRWMSVKAVIHRSDANTMTKYRKRFGDAWVETQGDPDSDDYAVRLKPLDEFRSLLEIAGEFIMIPAEEISDKAQGKPVHMGAINIGESIPPYGGETVREVMQNNLRAILEHEKSHGREVLMHLNHPNFHYAITAEELAAVVDEQFFEVYNGHDQVGHLGDEDHPSVERIWDLVNAIRLSDVSVPPIMGLGSDDSHEYHGEPGARPGRGWVMVRSRYLTPEHLIRAMKKGDFYASSGVTLDDVKFHEDTQTLSLVIQTQPGATYRTEFIATLKPGEQESGEQESSEQESSEQEPREQKMSKQDLDKQAPAGDELEQKHDVLDRIGRVVATVSGTHACYQLTGNELYVRAVVTSSQAAKDPSFENQKQQAWTQPVGWKLER